jgi:hypothetical protein
MALAIGRNVICLTQRSPDLTKPLAKSLLYQWVFHPSSSFRRCPKTSSLLKIPIGAPVEIATTSPAQKCGATASQRAVSGQSQGSRVATHQYSVAYVSAPPELRRRQGFVGFTGCRYRLPTFRGLFSRRYLVLLPVIVYM